MTGVKESFFVFRFVCAVTICASVPKHNTYNILVLPTISFEKSIFFRFFLIFAKCLVCRELYHYRNKLLSWI